MSAQNIAAPTRARTVLQGVAGIASLALAIVVALALIIGVISLINKLESSAVRALVCSTTHCLNLHGPSLNGFTFHGFTTPAFTTPGMPTAP